MFFWLSCLERNRGGPFLAVWWSLVIVLHKRKVFCSFFSPSIMPCYAFVIRVRGRTHSLWWEGLWKVLYREFVQCACSSSLKAGPLSMHFVFYVRLVGVCFLFCFIVFYSYDFFFCDKDKTLYTFYLLTYSKLFLVTSFCHCGHYFLPCLFLHKSVKL